MTANIQYARMSSILLTGLVAGTFFYGTLTVLPTFFEVSPDVHLTFRTTLMRRNPVVVMTPVILAVIVLGIYTWQARKIKTARMFIAGGFVCTLAVLLITRYLSVPLNLVIKTWDPAAPPADWRETLATWNVYNNFRTVASIVGFVCLILADGWMRRVT
jgi:uncharacterized membrane protein